MKSKIVKFLGTLIIIFVIIAGSLFYAIYVSPEKLTVKYETLSSQKIPESLDNVTIGYFSDIYYLEFMNEKRLSKMIEKINNANVDVLLFGGDLFANAQDPKIDADVINKLTEQFSKMEAPLGKFFVLGEQDCATSDTRTLVSSIFYNAGFEDLTNKNTKIHNEESASITLIGLDNTINGSVDIQSAFNATSEESFNVLFTHTPDVISTLTTDIINLAVAGHSLGGQVRLPLIGSLNTTQGAEKYNYGSYNFNKTTLAISNGLGTHKSDMRLFCPPQFNVFVLHKK